LGGDCSKVAPANNRLVSQGEYCGMGKGGASCDVEKRISRETTNQCSPPAKLREEGVRKVFANWKYVVKAMRHDTSPEIGDRQGRVFWGTPEDG